MGQDMLSSCGHVSESGLGNRHDYLQVRADTGVEFRGLVSTDRGGGLPGLPRTNPEAQSCVPVLGASR